MKRGSVEVIPIWEIPRSSQTKLVVQLLLMRQNTTGEPVWGVDFRKYVCAKMKGWIPGRGGCTIYAGELNEFREALEEACKELQKRIESDAKSEGTSD